MTEHAPWGLVVAARGGEEGRRRNNGVVGLLQEERERERDRDEERLHEDKKKMTMKAL